MYERGSPHCPPFRLYPTWASKHFFTFLPRSQLASSCLKGTGAQLFFFLFSSFQGALPQTSTPQILGISNPLISGIKTHAAWKAGVSGKTGNLLHITSWGTSLGSLLGSGQDGVMLGVFSWRGEGREGFENKGKMLHSKGCSDSRSEGPRAVSWGPAPCFRNDPVENYGFLTSWPCLEYLWKVSF